MTCSCATDPAACKPCAEQQRIDRQGRALVDLLDSGTMDPAARAEILGATTSADVAPSKGVRPWSARVRVIVEGL